LPEPVGLALEVFVEATEAAEAREERMAADDEAAAAAELLDAAADATESNTVVCTAVKMGCGISLPSSVRSLRMMTQ